MIDYVFISLWLSHLRDASQLYHDTQHNTQSISKFSIIRFLSFP